MQPEDVHHTVHDICCSGHVSRIFHDGDYQEKDQYIGQEYNHSSNATYDSIHQEIPGHSGWYQPAGQTSQSIHSCFDPVHGILSKGEGGMEHPEHDEHEDQKTKIFVCQHAVDLLGRGECSVPGPFFIGFPKCSGNKCISPVGNQCFSILPEERIQAVDLLRNNRTHVLKLVELGHLVQAIIIPLQQPDGVIAQVMTFQFIAELLQLRFDPIDGLLQFFSIIDMNMPDHRLPLFMHLNDPVQQSVNPLTLLPDSGYDGDTNQSAEFTYIQLITPGPQIVVHIQRYDHLHTHINKLGGKVHMTLRIPGINYVHHDIGPDLIQIFTHDHLLFRIS